MIRRPPRSTLFPYTRSSDLVVPLHGELERVLGKTLRAHQVGPRLVQHLEVARGHVEHLSPELRGLLPRLDRGDRKSTRLNSSHANISYAVFCLKKEDIHTVP